MPNRNSVDRFTHTTLPSLLQTIAHRSPVRSQYLHPDADSDTFDAEAMASITPREGNEAITLGLKTVEGISSSAANSSAFLSRSLPSPPQPSISFLPQIAP